MNLKGVSCFALMRQLEAVSEVLPEPVLIPTGDLTMCISTAEQWEGMLVM